MAPVLDSGQQGIVEVFVDFMKLRDLEEDGLDLLGGQHRLGRCSCGSQGLHGLKDIIGNISVQMWNWYHGNHNVGKRRLIMLLS